MLDLPTLMLLQQIQKQQQGQQKMSQEDGINILTNNPDAIGAYEDAVYQQQLNYSESPEVQRRMATMNEDQEGRRYYSDPGAVSMGHPFEAIQSPNYTVVQQGQHTTALPDGTIVIR